MRRIKNVSQRTYSLACPSALSLGGGGWRSWTERRDGALRPETGTLIKSLGSASDVLLTLCFSPDGARLAAGGADNAIHLYDVAAGKEQLVIQQHADWVTALVFSRDGKRLASASRDRSSRIYNSVTGELETSFNEHRAAVAAVALDAEGKQAFSAGKEKKILIWSATDARKMGEMGNFDGDINQYCWKSRCFLCFDG